MNYIRLPIAVRSGLGLPHQLKQGAVVLRQRAYLEDIIGTHTHAVRLCLASVAIDGRCERARFTRAVRHLCSRSGESVDSPPQDSHHRPLAKSVWAHALFRDPVIAERTKVGRGAVP